MDHEWLYRQCVNCDGANGDGDPPRKEDQITAFLVTPDMAGFKVKDYALNKVGMRGTKTANLLFENMEVPEANILGPKGKGLKVCLTVWIMAEQHLGLLAMARHGFS